MKQVRDPAQLRAALAERGLSQRQVGMLVGRSHGVIGHLLSGGRVGDDLARGIARVLACDTEALFVESPSSDNSVRVNSERTA